MKTITSFSTLMRLAHLEAKARLRGSPEEYAAAKAAHDDYHKLCLEADEMMLPQGATQFIT